MGFGAALWQELVADVPNSTVMARIVVRLVVALVLGGIVGLERAYRHKAAGMRTHMLVALGAAIVVLVPHLTGMPSADLSRVIQGIVTGIGFVGAGVIFRLGKQHVEGVTTAASIWLTAIVGIATGTGRLSLSVAGTVLALIIFELFGRLEHWLIGKEK